MKWAYGVFLLITLSATSAQTPFFPKYLVVWNVGQGQWVSVLQPERCLHFDAGGEFFPWKRLSSLCGKKQNRLFLSHWDWDHLGALAKWPHTWATCRALSPLGSASKHKTAILADLPLCPKIEEDLKIWTPTLSKDSNANSHVVEFQDFLIPGDSPQTQEKIWSHLPWAQTARVLILGHHGSRTSTSEELLGKGKGLRMAVASARWARYHHPHAETEALLKRHHLPLLRTEDWGHLWFEL